MDRPRVRRPWPPVCPLARTPHARPRGVILGGPGARRPPNPRPGGRGALRPSARRRRWLVQHEPVEAEVAYRFGELREVDRLADVAVDSELVAADPVLLLVGRRQDDDGK